MPLYSEDQQVEDERCPTRPWRGWCRWPSPSMRWRNDLIELRYPLCLTPRGEHIMGEVEFVVFPPVVWSKESLNVTPRTPDGISMISGVRIDERVLSDLLCGSCNPETVSGYAAQQSLMSVVPCSIQARITFFSVLAVLSGPGTRNVLPDSRSTLPNTRWPLTECPLWYFRRPNFLSSISTVFLGLPSFS